MSENRSTERMLLSGAFIPTFVVGLIGIGISSFFSGLNGFFAALLAQFVVLIYFVINFLVFRLSSTMEPRATMALALFSYFSKLLLLAIFLYGITSFISPELFNRTVFGINAIVLTFTWLMGEVRKFLQLKIHLPLPKSIPKE
jgi:ATP synthase protein I